VRSNLSDIEFIFQFIQFQFLPGNYRTVEVLAAQQHRPAATPPARASIRVHPGLKAAMSSFAAFFRPQKFQRFCQLRESFTGRSSASWT
jgi:hypothetical protein